MKITDGHYKILKEMVVRAVEENPSMPINDGSMRYRWMIYNLVCDKDHYSFARKLYEYLNDDHIDSIEKDCKGFITMKIKQFNKIIRECSANYKLDIEKIKALSDDIKDSMVYFLVRSRAQIIAELITDNIDRAWLYSMGYLYETNGVVHTCEHRISRKM